MRFLHIIASLTQGGTKKTLINFIKFGNKNDKHLIFVLKPGGFIEKELSKKIKILSPASTRFFDFIRFVNFMKDYCILNYKKHDIVLTWNYQSNLVSIFLKSKKLIWQIRSSRDKIFYSYKRFLYYFLNGIFSLKANKIIFDSHKSMHQHEKFFFNKNFKVIQNNFFKKKIKEECEKTLNSKYLFVLPTLNGGGAERVSSEIMKVINKKNKKITTDLLVLGKKTNIDYKKIFKGNINYLNYRKSFLSYFSLKKFLYKNDYEVIFSNIPNTNALLCILKFFSLKNFFLIIRESNMPNQPLKYKFSAKNLVNYILRYFYVFSDLIISPSKEINKYLKKILLFKNNKQFIHLPNYIDIQTYKKASKNKPKINLPKKYLLSLSNIQFQKNFELLILSFKKFIKKHPNFKLLIAGKVVEKKYGNEIRNLIQKNNLSHKIKLIGYIKNPFYLISNASAILSTSRWEGMPNSILQSCSLNKKVISTDCLSGPKEIKEYGFKLYLAKNNSLLDFTNKLILAMNHKTKINNKVALKKYNLNFLNKIEKILKVNV